MHFCADEVLAITNAVQQVFPAVSIYVSRFHAWWHAKKCPHASAIPQEIVGNVAVGAVEFTQQNPAVACPCCEGDPNLELPSKAGCYCDEYCPYA